MKSIRAFRIAVAALNVTLVALVGVCVQQVFFTRSDPHLPRLAVKDLAIPQATVESASRFEVIWKELDRVPPPPPEPEKAPPPVEQAGDLYRVALAVEDPRRAQDRIVILSRVGGAEQLVLRAGESSSGVTCEAIEREGADLVAVVKVSSGARGRLRVRRADEVSR